MSSSRPVRALPARRSPAASQAARDAATVRRGGKVVRAAAGLAGEARAPVRAVRASAPPRPPGPDQIERCSLGAVQALAERLPLVGELADHCGAVARRPHSRSGGAERHHLGAVAARCTDPEIDDRRALCDRVVADRRRRSPRPRSRTGARGTRSSAVLVSSGSTTRCEPKPLRTSCESAYAISTVSEPESARTTESPAARASRSSSSSASLPRQRLEAPRALDAISGALRGRRRGAPGARSGPCRRSSPGRPRDGCGSRCGAPGPRGSSR